MVKHYWLTSGRPAGQGLEAVIRTPRNTLQNRQSGPAALAFCSQPASQVASQVRTQKKDSLLWFSTLHGTHWLNPTEAKGRVQMDLTKVSSLWKVHLERGG